jgi:hypothetical protein
VLQLEPAQPVLHDPLQLPLPASPSSQVPWTQVQAPQFAPK